MPYIALLILLLSSPAFAQIAIDDGIRKPSSMVVSGSSVIDDEDSPIGENDDDNTLSDEEEELLSQTGTEGVAAKLPSVPEQPSTMPPVVPVPAQPKNVKRVVKPQQELKVRRSIADDRIDDSYVQDMVRDNYLFTPSVKDKKP